MNINLRKQSPTLTMLLQDMPLEFKVYGKRSNPVRQKYLSVENGTDDFLCNCVTRSDTEAFAAKHQMDNIFLTTESPWAQYTSEGPRSKYEYTSSYADNLFISSKLFENRDK